MGRLALEAVGKSRLLFYSLSHFKDFGAFIMIVVVGFPGPLGLGGVGSKVQKAHHTNKRE